MEILLVVVAVVVALIIWSSRRSSKRRALALEAHERRSPMSHIPENDAATGVDRPRVVDPKTGQEVIVADGETASRALQRAARDAVAAAAQQASRPTTAASVASDTFSFVEISVRNGNIFYRGEMQPVGGVRAAVETAGEIRQRTSIAQTIGGGLLFGPIGAVVGALVQGDVDERELYILIDGKEYAWAVDVDPKKGKEARTFAARVNSSAMQA